ncbi:MAG: VWA domain-containing protein [bacterium]
MALSNLINKSLRRMVNYWIAAGGLCTALLSTSPMPACAQSFCLTINQIDATEYPALSAYVTVTDNNNKPVTNLESHDFELVLDSAKVDDFSVRPIIPGEGGMAIVLNIDTSGSMKGEPLEMTKRAATQFVAGTPAKDEVAIVSFNDVVRVMQPFRSGRDGLEEKIRSLETAGKYTVLYDAVYESLQMASQTMRSRKAIVLLTDGKNENSVLTIDDCIGKAREVGIPVYAIGLGMEKDERSLARISKLTGGRYLYAPDPQHVGDVYDAILRQFQNQYVFEFSGGTGKSAQTPNLFESSRQLGVAFKKGDAYVQDIKGFRVVDKKGSWILEHIGLISKIIAGSSLFLLIVLAYSWRKYHSVAKCKHCQRPIDSRWGVCLFCHPEIARRHLPKSFPEEHAAESSKKPEAPQKTRKIDQVDI